MTQPLDIEGSHVDANGNTTGKERDSEDGLDDFEARYMGSNIGRFMSPDPDDDSGFENQDDPQSWNGYSYVRNNPLTLTDPDGRDYRVCVDNGNCVNYANMTDFQNALKGTGATLQNGQILVNVNGQNQVAGTYQFFVGPGVEGGGLQPDILGDTLIGGFAGGIVNAGRGFLEGLLGSTAREGVEGVATGVASGTASGATGGPNSWNRFQCRKGAAARRGGVKLACRRTSGCTRRHFRRNCRSA